MCIGHDHSLLGTETEGQGHELTKMATWLVWPRYPNDGSLSISVPCSWLNDWSNLPFYSHLLLQNLQQQNCIVLTTELVERCSDWGRMTSLADGHPPHLCLQAAAAAALLTTFAASVLKYRQKFSSLSETFRNSTWSHVNDTHCLVFSGLPLRKYPINQCNDVFREW